MNAEKHTACVKTWALTFVLLLVLAIFALPSASRAQAQGANPAPAPPAAAAAPPPPPILPGQTAGKHYENVHVLKNFPADQLIPTMNYIAMSLGVQCTYCHVAGAFPKDEKKTKVKARLMMKMVMKIDKDNFDKKHTVECFTCHRGSPIPLSSPFVPELGGRPPVALAGERVPGEPGPPLPPKPAPEVLPTADQIVAKYEQAIGGAKVSSLTTRTNKGTIEAGPAKNEFEQALKAPNKSYVLTHTRQGDIATGYDGSIAWQQNQAGRVRDFPGLQGIDQRRAADFFRTLDLKKSYSAFHDVSKAKVGDHDAYLVLADATDGAGTDKLYFDAASGLLVRAVQPTATIFGEIMTQFDYTDYRDADGVKVPYEVRLAKPDAITQYHFTEIKFNAAVEDAKFGRPADKVPPTTAASR